MSHIAPRVEIRFEDLTVDGAPTGVTFTVWRASGGKLDKIGTIEIDADELDYPEPQIYEFGASAVYVTVEFTGGASPSIDGLVYARSMFGA